MEGSDALMATTETSGALTNTPYRPVNSAGALIRTDLDLLAFVAEMSGVQLDQLAALLADRGEHSGNAAASARQLLARWRAAGLAETEALTHGEPWVWASRAGLNACGMRGKVSKPAAARLRHTHAVTDVRLAVERTEDFREGGAAWRSERTILSLLECRSEHVPDGEVHWPADTRSPWAGQAWAVEVELSYKSVERASGIMREVLTRTGDWARFAPSPVPTVAPRYARLVYVCSRASVRAILNARAEVGSPLSARIDVHDLPASAQRFRAPKRGW
jgi:hypothetical protein